MKKFVSLILVAASLAASARALVLGADVGYLVDAEEEYVSARLGHLLKTDNSLAHQLHLEVGYTSQSEAGLKADFLPVTLNYRADTVAANKLGYHFGVGAGFARTKIRFPGSGVPTISDSGTSLALQGFVGVNYQLGETTSFHAGAKYIWIDDVELLGTSADVGDDVALSVGLSVKF